jgi:hypothetical protein
VRGLEQAETPGFGLLAQFLKEYLLPRLKFLLQTLLFLAVLVTFKGALNGYFQLFDQLIHDFLEGVAFTSGKAQCLGSIGIAKVTVALPTIAGSALFQFFRTSGSETV